MTKQELDTEIKEILEYINYRLEEIKLKSTSKPIKGYSSVTASLQNFKENKELAVALQLYKYTGTLQPTKKKNPL